MYIVGVSRLFFVVWRMVRPWLDARTAEKINFLTLEGLAKLQETIDPSQLLSCYGGEAPVPWEDGYEAAPAESEAIYLDDGQAVGALPAPPPAPGSPQLTPGARARAHLAAGGEGGITRSNSGPVRRSFDASMSGNASSSAAAAAATSAAAAARQPRSSQPGVVGHHSRTASRGGGGGGGHASSSHDGGSFEYAGASSPYRHPAGPLHVRTHSRGGTPSLAALSLFAAEARADARASSSSAAVHPGPGHGHAHRRTVSDDALSVVSWASAQDVEEEDAEFLDAVELLVEARLSSALPPHGSVDAVKSGPLFAAAAASSSSSSSVLPDVFGQHSASFSAAAGAGGGLAVSSLTPACREMKELKEAQARAAKEGKLGACKATRGFAMRRMTAFDLDAASAAAVSSGSPRGGPSVSGRGNLPAICEGACRAPSQSPRPASHVPRPAVSSPPTVEVVMVASKLSRTRLILDLTNVLTLILAIVLIAEGDGRHISTTVMRKIGGAIMAISLMSIIVAAAVSFSLCSTLMIYLGLRKANPTRTVIKEEPRGGEEAV